MSVEKINRVIFKNIDSLIKINLFIQDAKNAIKIKKTNNACIRYMITVIRNFSADIACIKNDYYECSENLSNYYLNETQNFKKAYAASIIDLNIEAKIISIAIIMRQYLEFLEKIEKISRIAAPLAELIEIIESTIISTEIAYILVKNDYKTCQCGKQMLYLADSSEYICPKCNYVKQVISGPLRDNDQDILIKKIGSEPIRHFKFWMDGLQGLRKPEMSKADETLLITSMRLNNVKKHQLTCSMMRYYLKINKLANFNNDVVYLVSKFTGRSPPKISNEDLADISAKFTKAMIIFGQINNIDHDHNNRPYYPFSIYKIIEDLSRRKPEYFQLLECLHLQSKETTMKNDQVWERICEWNEGEMGIKFRSTNYVEATKNRY